jgi:D-alanine--poly(phosphoribitol) ligase subunit 1
LDDQLKILGHRLELEEAEAAIRDASGIPAVVAVGWPSSDSGTAAGEVFIDLDQVDTQALLAQLAYMVLWGIHPIKRFRLNPNGKLRPQSADIYAWIPWFIANTARKGSQAEHSDETKK